ncbi:Uroporphyrinogen decarboxylase [Candidatus Bealeia paramacronuclearis]|uniref:Uroporphyrinogen decarboxylase n=1 Tax=Candidatus Bealeia paramacronuclearis TaxID=1921001 RepID=A0ABZ2C1S8_9PROT|nr:Uroporphyrinogen decarboxylase [Candidatus Bealeia paramacronuclearis]
MKFLDIFQNNQGILESPPLWLMRQAGRYLPEYRALREKSPDFISFCFTPELTIEATLQPIRRFGFDAAIIFSDILVVPHALGQNVWFEKGEGPKCGPLTLDENFFNQDQEESLSALKTVFEAIKGVRADLPEETALIGFCGAPWTVLTYMIEGGKTSDFALALKFVREAPENCKKLLNLLSDFSARYLDAQVKAGAQVVQIFDSWSGAVPCDLFEELVVGPTTRLISQFKARNRHIPVIGFPKGSTGWAPQYVQTGIQALCVDQGANRREVVENTPPEIVLQGNLDPDILIQGGDRLFENIQNIHRDFRSRPYIFNLGHGIKPETPIENVEKLVTWVRDLK